MEAIAVVRGFVTGVSRVNRAGLLCVSMLLFWLAPIAGGVFGGLLYRWLSSAVEKV